MTNLHSCADCTAVFKDATALEKHQKKKYKCNEGKHVCETCGKCFQHRSGKCKHKKVCKGPPKTIDTQDREIDRLRTTIAAIHQQHISLNPESTSQTIINSGDGTAIVNNGNINMIQQHIHVHPMGAEDDSYILSMPIEDLLNRLGRRGDMRAMVEFFKLRRLDPNNPQNHNMLLVNKDDDEVHYYTKNGWRKTNVKCLLDGCLANDSHLLQCCLNPEQNYEQLPKEQRDLWQYIALDVKPHIGAVAYAPYDKYYDGTRASLSESTKILSDQCGDITLPDVARDDAMRLASPGEILLIEKSKEKQIQSQIELTKLQLELRKLELGTASSSTTV